MDKGITLIKGTPMIKIIYNKIKGLSDDIILIVKSEQFYDRYYSIFEDKVRIMFDIINNVRNPVIGAYSCFNYSKYEYTLILACDMPLIKVEALKFLIKNIDDYEAVLPIHPNGYTEPLHAIYKNKACIGKIKELIHINSNIKMMAFIKKLEKVCYLPVKLLRNFDPNLDIFYNVNTTHDIEYVEQRLEG